MGDAFKGAACFFEGLALIGRPGIRRWALTPVPLTALLFVAVVWWGGSWFAELTGYLIERVPEWLQWLEWLLWIVFVVFAGGVILLLFVMIAGLVSSPFNGPLAAAVEVHLTGREPPSVPLGQALRRLPRTLFGELAKVVYGLVITVPFLVLFLIPGLNIAAPVLWVLCCGWVTAFSFTDYALSNHGLNLAAIRRVLRQRWMLTMGFGCVAFVAFMIPLFNLLAVPAAVCGGAVLWVRELHKECE